MKHLVIKRKFMKLILFTICLTFVTIAAQQAAVTKAKPVESVAKVVAVAETTKVVTCDTTLIIKILTTTTTTATKIDTLKKVK